VIVAAIAMFASSMSPAKCLTNAAHNGMVDAIKNKEREKQRGGEKKHVVMVVGT
jgi:hypothetical protein